MIRLVQVAMVACAVSLSAGPVLAEPKQPAVIGHRGLLRDAPENTLANFGACIDLRLGFELDVRRTRDGQLICIHDDDVKRTTNGSGKVAEMTLAELRKLDAGSWFDPAFQSQRVPLLAEVFAMLAERKVRSILVAIDLKIDDKTVAAEVVRLAEKHGVLDQLVCIGLAIGDPAVRRKLRSANSRTGVAVLANTRDELPAAIKDADADWVYLRFVPTAEQVAQVHQAGKRVFLSGTSVSGREPENWRRAQVAKVDAVLTDYPPGLPPVVADTDDTLISPCAMVQDTSLKRERRTADPSLALQACVLHHRARPFS